MCRKRLISYTQSAVHITRKANYICFDDLINRKPSPAEDLVTLFFFSKSTCYRLPILQSNSSKRITRLSAMVC